MAENDVNFARDTSLELRGCLATRPAEVFLGGGPGARCCFIQKSGPVEPGRTWGDCRNMRIWILGKQMMVSFFYKNDFSM